eukprot:CAMPEP_0204825830 /NCGR_PEP_ID=MMETSP1346-20131115/3628_1 /ASSEMBLY_ACC=CAM_ASM_000771 /TAXON_ID=215587 /ORGANISM="Aplanochytrium stocchinoi, Strain GSBS06" /LENGTH=188 /DNA_ID=CAMNT_0051953591 /DNA_START=319 /DNA_END=885 /DNA_ORIENTATION=+
MQRRRKLESGEIWASKIFQTDESKAELENGEKDNIGVIFLGAGRDAKNLEKLSSHGITHIVNVADDVPNYHESHFEYLNLNVGDFGADAGISRVFDEAADYISKALEAKGKVLIHCANGSNRSATVTIAVLMIMNNLSLAAAWKRVCERRKEAAPLQDNRAQLLLFEKKMYGKENISMKEHRATLVPI